MSLEWFDRVCGDLQEYMESICDKYDEVGHITIDRAAKHPKIDIYVEGEDGGREVFCTIFFDPHNEEFYLEEFDLDLEQTTRIMLPDIEDIIDAVHENFHAYMESDDLISADELFLEDDEELVLDEAEWEDDEDYYDEEVHIEWTSPEVTAFSAPGEAEVSYQFGIIHETGDGVLRRFNRVITDDDEVMEDETTFLFSKEEAHTIVDLIQNNMELLEEYDPL